MIGGEGVVCKIRNEMNRRERGRSIWRRHGSEVSSL